MSSALPSKIKQVETQVILRIQRGFEAASPKLRDAIHFHLHDVPREAREELIHEAQAMAWDNYRKICLAGRDPKSLLNSIARFAALKAYEGGHLAGEER